MRFFFIFIWLLFVPLVASTSAQSEKSNTTVLQQPVPGAHQLKAYLPKLKQKRVALVVNHTSKVGSSHLVDTLLKGGVDVTLIFAPEHGFRGTEADGETIADGMDAQTKVPVVSLYGKNKKPTPEQMRNIDVVVFDIQDVGVRFYTYLSTMHLVMEACADAHKSMIVLDRPNPNGHYVDGPILDKQFESFVGMHPIPIVYGLTLGEMANMIKNEKWLKTTNSLDLTVIKCQGYAHKDAPRYDYPIAPSPNLKTKRSILLYPSLCLLEGTIVSIGRGTELPFLVYGSPKCNSTKYSFTPQPNQGSVDPPQKGKVCYGNDLSKVSLDLLYRAKTLNLGYFFEAYACCTDKDNFFLTTNYVDKLYGSDQFRKLVKAGKTEEHIRQTWSKGLAQYKLLRQKYLLYP